MSVLPIPENYIKTQTLVITGKLPSRNEADNAARAHWSQGAKFKREYTELVHWCVIGAHIKPVHGKAHIVVTFYERDDRRDADNIIGGALKYILDGLVAAGIVKDDSRKYVDLTIMPIKTDKSAPRIEINITGVIP